MITVFTPTYNRAYILSRCYQSLIGQTTHNFKWLIVDDGSSDDTESLVSKWMSEKKLDITYIKQVNAGKPAAHNTGVLNCDTELFICLDSDDFFKEDAIEAIYKEWETVKHKKDIVGLAMLKAYEDGKLTGTYFPNNLDETSIYDLYEEHHFKGELALIFRTEIIKDYLFPIFNDEKFIGESVVYDLLSQHYKVKLVNTAIYLCEYMEDGYSKNAVELYKRNPKGYLYYLNQRVSLAQNTSKYRRSVIQYMTGCWRIGYSQWFKDFKDKKTLVIVLPIALKNYLKFKLKNILIQYKLLDV